MIEPVSDGLVRGFLHRADSGQAGLVLAHGVGSNCQAPLLKAVAEALAGAGVSTLRIDLPFRQNRAKGPPYPAQAVKDREGIFAAVQFLRRSGCEDVCMGGHSYGGRQASMLAAEEPGVANALLLLSYPLHPPGRQEEKRTAHWPKVRVPALLVHGTRDPFGTPEELQASLKEFGGDSELLLVEGGGHELKSVLQRPEQVVRAWVRFGTVTGRQPSNG